MRKYISALTILLSIFSGSILLAQNKPQQKLVTSAGGNQAIMHVLIGGVTAWQWPIVNDYQADKKALNLRVIGITEPEMAREVDLSNSRFLYLQGFGQNTDKESFRKFIINVRKSNPNIRIACDARSFDAIEQNLPGLAEEAKIEKDPEITKYANFNSVSVENMRRLLIYFAATYLGRDVKVEPPEVYGQRRFYHPDHEDTFETAEEFLKWALPRAKNPDAPRVLMETHMGHILWKSGRMIDAILREFDRQGFIAAALDTSEPDYMRHIEAFKPELLMGLTAKSGNAEFYIKYGVPKMQPGFIVGETISEWQLSEDAARSGARMGGMLVLRESEGSIEPHTLGGPESNALDMSTPCVPIPERIEHFVARAASYLNLTRKENKDKKIAIQYLGPPAKDAALVGTPDTVYGDSIIKLLKALKNAGYQVSNIPRNQDELIALISQYGRQIYHESADELNVLVKSGKAALIPEETYRRWFEQRVPKADRDAVIKEWGAVPGEFMVWENSKGEKFLVVPKIEFGNIYMVAAQGPEYEDLFKQEVRTQLLDRIRKDPYGVVPSHNQLAANFWMEEEFKADALIVWEFLVMDYLLPKRTAGLRNSDWPDILMGRMANFRIWPICELNWSLPAKRKTRAVLIDHLTSPDTAAGLSDELLNIQNDVLKWSSLPDGALEEKFRKSVAEQVKKANLDQDLHFDLGSSRALTTNEMHEVADYLNSVFHQKINVSDHILGEAPADEKLIPWIAQCLNKKFFIALEEIMPITPEQANVPGGMKQVLQTKAAEALTLYLRKGFAPTDALKSIGAKIADGELPENLKAGFDLAKSLDDGFARTDQEIDNLLRGLEGKLVPPGPGNLPERNPAVVPTGRNMFIMNPDEIPSKASWELGCQMVDQLLKEKLESTGRYPEKIALSLHFRSTLMDYGVLESEILYLMGVRPVWDAANRVHDVELIPAKELGRPRIDVFIETYDTYVDYLDSRLRLWDKAVRLVTSLDEPDNYLFNNSQKVIKELQADGLPAEKAAKMSKARIFSQAPGMAFSAHALLFEQTDEWSSRRELVDMYMAERDYAYTDGVWGEKMPEAYRRQLQGTEIVLRNITRGGPLTMAWYNGGNLCLVVKEITGKEPEYFLSDLRTPGEERLVLATDAVREDMRATIFNRTWIEGMMKEDYAGAQRMYMATFSTFGWEVNKAGSISQEVWQEIADVYLRDKKNLKIKEWFESKNPHALQGIAQTMLESARKEYWRPDEATLLEVTKLYVENVIKFGHREPGEIKRNLDAFITRTIHAPNPDSPLGQEMRELLKQYNAKTASEVISKEDTVQRVDQAVDSPEQPVEPVETEQVTGKKLSPIKSSRVLFVSAGVIILLGLLGYGFIRRKGALR